MNFEVNYSSFFQDFAQFDGLVSSPMIPEFSTPSPGDCLSNSSTNLDQSPQIDTPPPPSESTLPNVDNDQGKKKRRPRNNGGNSRPAKGKKTTTDKEATKNPACTESTDNSNQSEKGGRGRKRTYEETVEGNRKNSSNNSSVDPEPQPEVHNRKHHVIAERKRREKLMQRFIALSSLVPGLTRMDKASVLADAIRYVKQLQERVQTLETEATHQKNAQAAVVIKKSQSTSPDECNSSTTCGDNTPVDELSTKAAGPPPEIEVRISEQRVLIKIHCEGQKGVLVKALSEIESLGLAIVSTTVVPFTSSSLDITITAKVNEELSLTVEDLVKRLNFVLNNCNSFP